MRPEYAVLYRGQSQGRVSRGDVLDDLEAEDGFGGKSDNIG